MPDADVGASATFRGRVFETDSAKALAVRRVPSATFSASFIGVAIASRRNAMNASSALSFALTDSRGTSPVGRDGPGSKSAPSEETPAPVNVPFVRMTVPSRRS
jgi:hypothetical protein